MEIIKLIPPIKKEFNFVAKFLQTKVEALLSSVDQQGKLQPGYEKTKAFLKLRMETDYLNTYTAADVFQRYQNQLARYITLPIISQFKKVLTENGFTFKKPDPTPAAVFKKDVLDLLEAIAINSIHVSAAVLVLANNFIKTHLDKPGNKNREVAQHWIKLLGVDE